jgi:hypothetical protein
MSRFSCCQIWAAMLVTALAVERLRAEEKAAAADETVRYVESYEQFVKLLQEAKFDYASTQTRSTPRLGVAGRWEQKGTLRVSAARRAFHLSSTAARMHPANEDLGGTEVLATPKRYFEISIPSKRDPEAAKNQYGVTTLLQLQGDEWKEQVDRNELGVLIGYKQLGCEFKTPERIRCQDRHAGSASIV